MKALVYSSKACVTFTLADLQQLADSAAQRNQADAITGYLYFDKGRFMQYLEGEVAALEDLKARLLRDPRHQILRMVEDEALTERRLPHWHMRWLQQGSLVQIRLEHILYDFMQLKTPRTQNRDLLAPHVWHLVEQIINLQKKHG